MNPQRNPRNRYPRNRVPFRISASSEFAGHRSRDSDVEARSPRNRCPGDRMASQRASQNTRIAWPGCSQVAHHAAVGPEGAPGPPRRPPGARSTHPSLQVIVVYHGRDKHQAYGEHKRTGAGLGRFRRPNQFPHYATLVTLHNLLALRRLCPITDRTLDTWIVATAIRDVAAGPPNLSIPAPSHRVCRLSQRAGEVADEEQPKGEGHDEL
eukprot:gene16806-biopygen6344